MSDADNSLPPSGQKLKLIVTKLIAFRPQDEADTKDLLAAYRSDLDLAYVREEFATVADANNPQWVTLDAWINERQDE